MPIVQTEYGPKPTLSLVGGSPTDLAVPSMPFTTYGGSGITTTGGLTVSYAKLYRTQPWVAAAANLLSRQTARLPLKTYRFLDAAQEERQRVRDHALTALLNRPAPRRRGLHLRWQIALALNVHGNYVGWKHRPRRGAPPDQLITLDWRLLIPRGDGRIEAWEWTGRPYADLPRYIDPADVVHIAWDAPEGAIGVSPLEQLGITLAGEDAAQRFSQASFRNGVRPGVAAILDKSITADKVKRDGIRDELTDAHGGVDQAFRPAVLGGGIIDLKPMGNQSAVEAELISYRKVNREEVAAVYDAPQPLIGILDNATLANVESYHRQLYLTTLGPPLSLIAESLQAQLVDDEPAWIDDGVFVEFDLSEVLKGDTAARMDAYATALQNGILTLNDVRRRENEKPYDDPRADEPLLQANNVRPLSAIGEAGDDAAGDKIAGGIIDLIRDHTERALTRTARGVGAGKAAVEAFNADRVRAELEADLRAGGSNGSSTAIADAVAVAVEDDLRACDSVDDVRALTDRYLPTAKESPSDD